MSHITGTSKNQCLLLPPVIEEWIPKDHPARVVEIYVNTLDVRELGFKVENDLTGRPSYDPKELLKILLYGYTNGERSSRKLERRTYEDLGYIWLTGNLHPDYRTIARFRQMNTEALKGLLKETLNLYVSVGYKFDGTIFVDGTKLYANASDGNVATQEKIKKLEAAVEKILKEAEDADKNEDKRDGDKNGNFIDEEKLKKLEEKIKKSKKALEETGRKTVSLTDKDSRFMKHSMGHGKHLSYNAQLSVDKNGVILEAEVETKASDDGELLKARVKGVEENIGKEVKVVVGDAGYYETNAIKEIMESGKKCIVPKRPTQEKDKENFKYNKKRDIYKCTEGNELHLIRKRIDKGKSYLEYAADKKTCINCKHAGKCFKGNINSKYGRRIMIYEDREYMLKYRRMIKRNQKTFKKRKTTVEPTIGVVKEQHKFRRFLLRGTEKVRSEWKLVTAAANLAKLARLMPRLGLNFG